MTKQKIVIALGGNALNSAENQECFEEQMTNAAKAAKILARVVKNGNKVLITHGNGPQVGNILLQQEIAKENVAPMPLSVCGAQSQGQIGTILEQTLNNELKKLRLPNRAIVIVSHVLVNSRDQAFSNPTKPIGPFYTPIEAKKLRKKGMVLKEIMTGSYRRVVPSPVPLKILEIKAIKRLFENGFIPIAVGGGGIPMIERKGKLKAVEAVIDKDLASEILASSIGVDKLAILTNVKAVAINFRKPDQKWLGKIRLAEIEKYLKRGYFPPGSMGPKVQAIVKFLKKNGEKAFIGHLKDLMEIIKEKKGTIIIK